MQNRWCENHPCGRSVASGGYLENEVTLPQGDSDLDDSNFLLGVSLIKFGVGSLPGEKQQREIAYRCSDVNQAFSSNTVDKSYC